MFVLEGCTLALSGTVLMPGRRPGFFFKIRFKGYGLKIKHGTSTGIRSVLVQARVWQSSEASLVLTELRASWRTSCSPFEGK